MDEHDFPLTQDAIERTPAAEDPPQLGALYNADEVWTAYDARDQGLRRARWTAVAVAWVMGHDDMAAKLVGPMDLAELIDLDSVLTDLRHEVRRAIARLDAPAPEGRGYNIRLKNPPPAE
jgi:hypothetical protein